jgi:hypothetical protein
VDFIYCCPQRSSYQADCGSESRPELSQRLTHEGREAIAPRFYDTCPGN